MNCFQKVGPKVHLDEFLVELVLGRCDFCCGFFRGAQETIFTVANECRASRLFRCHGRVTTVGVSRGWRRHFLSRLLLVLSASTLYLAALAGGVDR